MNKLLFVLLAVCLVSVHAFVKRDAPAAKEENFIATAEKQIQDMMKNMNEGVTKVFNPEEFKKSVNTVIDNLNKALNEMKSKSEAPK